MCPRKPGLSIEAAFGQAVRHIRREQAGISQELLALAAGLDRAYVSKIERGLVSPSLKTIFKLAQALQTTPDEVLRRTQTLAPAPG